MSINSLETLKTPRRQLVPADHCETKSPGVGYEFFRECLASLPPEEVRAIRQGQRTFNWDDKGNLVMHALEPR